MQSLSDEQKDWWVYAIPGVKGHAVTADYFVRDWRVAGAMLSEAEWTMDSEDFYHALLPLFHEALISSPRAIAEAMREALT